MHVHAAVHDALSIGGVSTHMLYRCSVPAFTYLYKTLGLVQKLE